MLSMQLTLHEAGFMHLSGQIRDMNLMLRGILRLCQFTIEKESGGNALITKMHRKGLYINMCWSPRC